MAGRKAVACAAVDALNQFCKLRGATGPGSFKKGLNYSCASKIGNAGRYCQQYYNNKSLLFISRKTKNKNENVEGYPYQAIA